jgi:hypothetical protein
MQDNDFDNIEIMIFTSSAEKAWNELRKLGVNTNSSVKITTSPNEALNFLIT